MKRILIIKHGAFGDVVLSMYPLFAIKDHYKNSHITVLTGSLYYDFFKSIPFVNDIKIDNRPRIYNLLWYLKFLYWFRKKNFEWVFDLQTSKRTNIYFYFFSFLKKINWNGTAKNSSHPHINPNRVNLHTIDRQKEQLACAGIKLRKKPDWNLFKKKDTKFKFKKPYAMIVAGGSKHRHNKRWSTINFLKLIQFLNKKKIISVLIGGKGEELLFNNNFKKHNNVINLIGKTTFNDLANISSKASLIVGNDTGPMHLIVVCSPKNIKKIVLFGSGSDPKLCAPKAENVFILRKKNINEISPSEVQKIINKKNYRKV